MNVFVLSGNLVQDPELKYIADNRAVAKFRIATNRVYKTKKVTSFFDGEIWGRNAENFAKYLKKGRPVILKGYLRQDTWQTAEESMRSKVVLVADDFSFADAPKTETATTSETAPEPELDDIPI